MTDMVVEQKRRAFVLQQRVAFEPGATLQNGTGTLVTFVVPSGQTLLISEIEFYASRPNPLFTSSLRLR